MRKLTISLVILVIAVVTLASGLSKNNSITAEAAVNTSPSQQTESISNDPPGTIDGAKNPEMIPDDVAYSLFFRFLSDRQTEKEKSSMRSYFKQSTLNGLDVDALLAIGEEFKKKVAVVDAQAKAFRDQTPMHPNDQAMSVYREQYKAITMELIASLPVRIGTEAAEKVRQHIIGRVKSHVKIVPGPIMPDGLHNMPQD